MENYAETAKYLLIINYTKVMKKCDAIQQKVHKVRKLVNAVEIGIGDQAEHKKRSIKLIDACEVEL